MGTLLTSFADAFRSLRSNFLQTFLSMLGVIIGVGALVAMLSMIDGLEQMARDTISDKTPLENMSISANTHRSLDGIRIARDTVASFDAALLSDLLAEIPFETKAQLSNGSTAIGKAGDSLELGITYRAISFPVLDKDFDLEAGRWPNEVVSEVKSSPVEGLINYQLALKLVAPDTAVRAALGKKIAMLGGEIEVVGVAEKSDKIDVLGLIFSHAQLGNFPQAKQTGGEIMLEFASVEDVLPAQRILEPWLTERFVGIEEPVTVSTYTGYLEGLEEGFLIFRLVMGFLIGIAVVVGGVGIMNVLVMSVIERTPEIGIRKAIGANRRTIISQFLSESIALSVIGSLLGTLLGIGVAMVASQIVSAYSSEMQFQAVFTLNTLVVVGIVAVLIGCIFGTYPALRASRLDPVSAIQRV